MNDIEAVNISTHQLDETGLVTVWSRAEQKWIKRSPIDAKEGIAYGVLSLSGPDESPDTPDAPNEDAIIARLVEMTKSELRQLGKKHSVDFTAADTKESLIQRLIVAGVIPD